MCIEVTKLLWTIKFTCPDLRKKFKPVSIVSDVVDENYSRTGLFISIAYQFLNATSRTEQKYFKIYVISLSKQAYMALKKLKPDSKCA